jgi:cytochrome c peroxidase
VLKELQDKMGNVTGALTVMVKRGADFNPDGNGWEWFMTDVNLTTVLTQGDNATAGDGMCATCHAGANTNSNGTDWVFNH